MLKYILTAAVILTAAWGYGADFFKNGSTDWSIVIAPAASSSEVLAAEELKTYLKKISKADFPIVKSSTVPAGNAIVIGTKTSFPALQELTPQVPSDEQDSLRVLKSGSNLYLLGNNNRSALYAAYTLLEELFGVRWLYMGESGEVVPEKSAFTLPEKLDIQHTSRFRYRGFHVCGTFYHDQMELWMARNKLNMIYSNPANGKKWIVDWNKKRAARGFHIMFANHNIAIYNQKTFQEKPELYALVNGNRIYDQLCWSNPEVDKIMINNFIKACKELPEVEIINMFPADNMNYCQCAKCSQFKRTDLWFNMLKRLGDGIRKVYPDKKIASIAYQAYIEPPEVDLDGMQFIEYCMYDRCYVHKFSECQINQKVLERLARWQKKNVGIPVYGYEFDIFSFPMKLPFGKMLEDQLNTFEKLGLWGSIPEALAPNFKGRNAAPSGRNSGEHWLFEYYLYAGLMWDKNRSFDTVCKDYTANAFDAAAPSMEQYYQLLANAWSNMKIHYSYFYNSHLGCSEHLLNPKLISEVQKLFKSADSMAEKIADPQRKKIVQENLQREKDIFQGWVKTYHDYIASSQGSKVLLPKARKMLDFTGSAVLPPFRTRSGKPQEPTTVRMNYDDQNLYLDIVCYDKNIKSLVANASGRDAALWNDETVEIFITIPNDTEGIYRHLIFNAKGERYDAIALGGMTFNTAWNPNWQVKSFIRNNCWGAQVVIPFADLGRKPERNEVWPFTINRNSGISRKGIINSGFPDATVHDPNAFGAIQFCNISESRNTFFFSRHSEVDVREMKMLIENAGYQTLTARSEKLIPSELPEQKVYILRWTRGVKLPEKFNQQVWRDLNNGALVMFVCWGELELEKYFNDPTLQLKWSGWRIDPKRKSYNVKPGSWQTKPDDMSFLVNKGLTPANGYKPIYPEAWQNMGELKMKDGSMFSFLLTRQVGKGLLVVCSGDFGMSGGGAMFGSRKNQSVMLLNNMYQYMLDTCRK